MITRGRLRLVVLWLVLAAASAEDTCPLKQDNCQCDFSPDAEDGGESVAADTSSKSEAMAAAAGAMSPLLIGGAGLGIWKLVKSKGSDDSLERSDSSLSERPPQYSSRRGSGDEETFANTRGANPTSRNMKPSVNENVNSWM